MQLVPFQLQLHSNLVFCIHVTNTSFTSPLPPTLYTLTSLVTFCNTLKIILTNPNRPQRYGTQSTSHPTPTKHQTHVGDPSSTSKSSCCSSDSQDDLTDPRPNTNCLPGHCCC